MFPARTHGSSNSNLSGALRHVHQHHVHNADTPYEQQHACDTAKYDVEYPLSPLRLPKQHLWHDDMKVLNATVTFFHNSSHHSGGRQYVGVSHQFDDNLS